MTSKIGNRFIPAFVFSSAIYAIVTPYLAILIRNLGYSPVWVGILLGINNGAGIAGPILFGSRADKTGNYRPCLIVSCILPALVAFPLILWVHPAVSAVLLALMAFGLRSTGSLIDAITTIQIGRTGNYGRVRVWGSISFILVTLFLQWTPFLKPNSAGNITLWIAITSCVSVIPILILPARLMRSVSYADEQTSNDAVPVKASVERPGRGKPFPVISKYIIGGFGVIFLCSFSMAIVYSYFPLYLTGVLQWDAVGLVFAVATASEVPLMFLSGALIRRYGSLPLLTLSASGICLRLLIWAFLPFKPWIIASQLLHSLCFGIFHPAAVYFTAGIFPAKKRGIGMSMYMALGTGLPSLIGNMAGGAIVAAAGYRFLFGLYAAVAGMAVLISGAMRFSGLGKEKGR